MKIRRVLRTDLSHLISMMSEFASFDGSDDEFEVGQEELIDLCFGDPPKMFCLVAEEGKNLVGFLNYFISYSSFEGKPSIWVEDVFIRETHRRIGLGTMFFSRVKEIAEDLGCVRLEWLVRKNNKSGIAFYEKLGAKVDDGTVYVKWSV